jgi:hypothetical protein
MAGGFDTDLAHGLTITREVDVLDPTTSTWTTLPPLPVMWTHMDLVAAGGALYLLGGLEGQAYTVSGLAYVLDAGAADWRAIAPLPPGLERGSAGLVVAPPHIILVGGASTIGGLKTVLDYDLSQNTWSQLPDLPSPRSHAAAMRTAEGTLIVAGGLKNLDATEPLDEVWALPLGASTWQPRQAMPSARGGCAYGVLQSRLICAGGEVGQVALDVAAAYDPYADRWTMLPEMTSARAGTQGAVVGTSFYVPGGAPVLRFEPLATLDVYAPL